MRSVNTMEYVVDDNGYIHAPDGLVGQVAWGFNTPETRRWVQRRLSLNESVDLYVEWRPAWVSDESLGVSMTPPTNPSQAYMVKIPVNRLPALKAATRDAGLAHPEEYLLQVALNALAEHTPVDPEPVEGPVESDDGYCAVHDCVDLTCLLLGRSCRGLLSRVSP